MFFPILVYLFSILSTNACTPPPQSTYTDCFCIGNKCPHVSYLYVGEGCNEHDGGCQIGNSYCGFTCMEKCLSFRMPHDSTPCWWDGQSCRPKNQFEGIPIVINGHPDTQITCNTPSTKSPSSSPSDTPTLNPSSRVPSSAPSSAPTQHPLSDSPTRLPVSNRPSTKAPTRRPSSTRPSRKSPTSRGPSTRGPTKREVTANTFEYEYESKNSD